MEYIEYIYIYIYLYLYIYLFIYVFWIYEYKTATAKNFGRPCGLGRRICRSQSALSDWGAALEVGEEYFKSSPNPSTIQKRMLNLGSRHVATPQLEAKVVVISSNDAMPLLSAALDRSETLGWQTREWVATQA